jgi:hypothetical protein
MGKIKSSVITDAAWLLVLGLVVCVFFYKTIVFGLLPIPTDVLVGRYHPWKDSLLSEYPRGFPYKNFLITDPIRQQILWRKQAIDAWKADEMPGWDPSSFGGSPLNRNVQSGAFYPLNILFLLLPFEWAWTGLVMSQMVGMLWFTYIFLRSEKLSGSASFFGSIVAGFSGFSISWLTWGTMVSALMWLPLLLLGIKKLSTKKPAINTLLWILILMSSAFSTITAGHLQIAFYVITAAFFYWVHRTVKNKNIASFYPLVAAIGLIALLIRPAYALMQFLATTVRGGSVTGWQEDGYFVPIRHLVQFIIPDYFGHPSTMNYWGAWNYGEHTGYIGILGLFMAIVGGVYLWKRNSFWIAWVIICLVLAVHNPIAWIPYWLEIPFLSSLQPTRLMALINFGLAVLAAYGFNTYISKPQMARKVVFHIALISAAIIVLAVFWASIKTVFNIDTWGGVSIRNSVIPMFLVLSALVVSIVFRRKHAMLTAMLLGVLVVDLLRFGWKFTPFTEARFLFPPTKILDYLQQQQEPFRVLALDTETAPANSLGWYGIETLGGYNPIYTKRYAQFIHLFENGYVDQDPPIFQRLFDPLNFDSPLSGIANVRYALTIDPNATVSGTVIMQEGETLLLERETLPRWYIADSSMTFPDGNSVLSALAENRIGGFPAYVETGVDISTSSGVVEIANYSPNSHRLVTVTAGEGFLVNSTAWDPHWKAYIDDAAVEIFKTNHLFMGIQIPDGKHHVRFEYDSFKD